MRQRLIGLTGPSGAGKSAVGALFLEFGIPVYDTDKIYHEIILPPSPCLDEITAYFGDGILNPDGTLNRPSLARIVFSDNDKLAVLNSISHKYILRRVRELCEDIPASFSVVDAPLLFESGFDRECEFTIAVLAAKNTRIKRIIARDGLSQEQAQTRINAQPDNEYYTSNADIVIYNDYDINSLRRYVVDIIRSRRLY